MKRLIACALVLLLVLVGLAPVAEAHHTATNVALGLASFAVFNQLFGGFAYPRYHVVRYVYEPPPVVYYTQPVVYAAPQIAVVQAPTPSVVHYPHGRHELHGSAWVWIPNPPAPPPAAECRLTGKYVKTPSGFQPECE